MVVGCLVETYFDESCLISWLISRMIAFMLFNYFLWKEQVYIFKSCLCSAFKDLSDTNINTSYLAIQYDKILGKGQFGIVYQAKYNEHPVAVKLLQSKDVNAIQQFQQEARLLM